VVRACAPRTGARARAARIGPAAARHAPSGSAAGPAAPLVGDLLPHLVKPNRELLIRLMASMGEKDTIVRYPQLIESLGAAAREPINSAANLTELQAIISPFGFRRSARVAPGELRWSDRRDVADLWLFFGSGSARRCHA
jgi:hypothetical protein